MPNAPRISIILTIGQKAAMGTGGEDRWFDYVLFIPLAVYLDRRLSQRDDIDTILEVQMYPDH
jgi:hypothetical protein